jgi:hypothetical protein
MLSEKLLIPRLSHNNLITVAMRPGPHSDGDMKATGHARATNHIIIAIQR